MKKSTYVCAALIFLAGCRAQPLAQDQSVANTYYHPYGFAMSEKEWVSHGQNGKIVSHLKGGSLETVQYENGKRQGLAEWTFPYSRVVEKSCVYDKDALVSETSHYDNGAPQKRVEFLAEGSQQITVWYQSGSPQAKETWKDKRLLEATYYDEKGAVEASVVSGTGERLEKEDRSLMATEHYEAGVRNLKRQMHPNGQLAAEILFAEGKPSGQARYYDVHGELVMTESWVDGYRQGDTLEYSRGEVVAQVPYTKGLKCGQEKRYRMGELVETMDWVEGKKFGPHHMYVDKQIVKTEYYYYDIPVSKVAFEKMILQ